MTPNHHCVIRNSAFNYLRNLWESSNSAPIPPQLNRGLWGPFSPGPPQLCFHCSTLAPLMGLRGAGFLPDGQSDGTVHTAVRSRACQEHTELIRHVHARARTHAPTHPRGSTGGRHLTQIAQRRLSETWGGGRGTTDNVGEWAGVTCEIRRGVLRPRRLEMPRVWQLILF